LHSSVCALSAYRWAPLDLTEVRNAIINARQSSGMWFSDFETKVGALLCYLRFYSSISDHHSRRRLMIGQRFDQRESVGVLRWFAVLVAIVAAFLLIYFEPPPLVH
jgi:hypothetical protein